MGWGCLTLVAVFINAASSQFIRCPCGVPIAPAITSAIAPAIAPAVPAIVDGNIVQSLIDTLQLFIVSDLIEETLPEKKVIVSSPVYLDNDCDILPYYDIIPERKVIRSPVYFENNCDILPYYDIIQEREVITSPVYFENNCDILPYYDIEYCPNYVTTVVSRPAPICVNAPVCIEPKEYVNFGLNEELVLPPLAPELPCGLGYLPGALPVVAKAFAPSSKCCACGCGCTPCSTAALPICSPCSCAALAAPLNPDMSGFIKPVIL